MKVLVGATIILVLGAGFFLFFSPRVVVLKGGADAGGSNAVSKAAGLLSVPEAKTPSSSAISPNNASADISDQRPLPDPPAVANGVYLTGWSAGSESKVNSVLNLIEQKGLNTVVIDIKDYSGYVAYQIDAPEVKASGAENQIRILRPNALIKKLHDNHIYVIARITVFQDPVLAKANPEWALKNKTTGKIWLDNHGLAWLDPAAKPVWDYDISIAKDALSRGFDEINFDYVRFASDGDLNIIKYPFWDQKTARHEVIRKFFSYVREKLPNARLSADLFGLSTVDSWDDLGIGQVIEDAYQYFDYVSPMVYPSHYAAGTLGYKNPAQHPYEVIRYSLEHALARLIAYGKEHVVQSTSTPLAISYKPFAKLRPWLQAFDLGAVYDSAMIDKEIQAVNDVLSDSSSTLYFAGYLFWDPANNYHAL